MSFSYECYRHLKRYLGATDALIELNHLAIADFRSAAISSGDAKAFITAQAKEHRIHVHFSAFPEMAPRLAQQSLVLVHEAWLRFLSELKDEWCLDNETKWLPRDDGEDPLTHALRAVGNITDGRAKLGEFRVALMEYFRLARNCVAHEVKQKYETYFERSRKALISESAQIKEHYGRLPAKFEALGLADVIMYSRVIKDTSLLLTRA